uniref:anti-phage deoxyguanosine triphosphatase n=1 Tax=Thioclava sp. GXIMD4216 TaxID=3131929 RepID=UPI0040401032
MHSASFRRLQAKTQVLGLGDGDFYRTRLTHSMEVSQIGVSITKKLFRDAKAANFSGKEHVLSQAAINYLPHPMLMSTICLAHDIGHPPFGHGGEVALNRCMLPYGGFEGNGQTLRIVTKLEKYAELCGMNLTRRAVLGVIKYPAPFSETVDWNIVPGGKPASVIREAPLEKGNPGYKVVTPDSSLFVASDFKPPKCYLDEEHEDTVLNWVAKDIKDWDVIRSDRKPKENGKHAKTKYKCLDTSIMELADDIAYGVHDLEDAIGLGLISRRKFLTWFDEKEQRKKNLSLLLDKIFDGKFEAFTQELFDKPSPERKRAIGQMVGFFVENTSFSEEHPELSEPLFRYQAKFCTNPGRDNSTVESALEVLRSLVVDLVIRTPAVQQLEFKGQKMVSELFEAFATDPKRLLDEEHYRKTIQAGGKITTARVICDYIAGMTDNYATKRYQQLFEPLTGSVFDRL